MANISTAASIRLFLKNIYHSPSDIERYSDEYSTQSTLVYIVEKPNVPAIMAMVAIANMGIKIHLLIKG